VTCRSRQRFRWLVGYPASSEEEEVLEVTLDSRVARRKASEPHLEPQTIDTPSDLVERILTSDTLLFIGSLRAGRDARRRYQNKRGKNSENNCPLQSGSKRSHPFRAFGRVQSPMSFAVVVISGENVLGAYPGNEDFRARIGAQHTRGNWVYASCGKMRSVWTVGTFVGAPHQNGGK
jgi:hypothetical protein